MLSCTGCKRFLREDAQACPFCGVLRETAIAPIVLAVAVGVALAACGPAVAVGDGSTGDADTSASATLDGPNTTMPTTSPTTSPSTTANPTVATSMTDTATDTATETTTYGDEDVLDEGCAFYGGCPTDWGGSSIECDVWAQDCQDGQKCMPWANDGGQRWNATKCSPLDATPGAPGDPCTVEGSAYSGIDDCDIGTMCWNVDSATNQGTCVANCSGSEANPSCPDDPNAQCLIEYDGVIHICVGTCDPRVQDCIATSECVPDDDAFFCVPDASGDEGQAGDFCEAFDGCDPGLFCAGADLVPDCIGSACCTEFCDIALPDPDTECSGADQGVQCLPWYEDGTAPPGSESIGACLLPS